jgi:hypothetical protein
MINAMTVKAMNKELETILQDFAAKHKLSLGNQRIAYARDGSTMKLSVEFGDTATTGDANPVYFKDCARNGWQYGLATSMIGKKVPTRKGECAFVGMRGKFAIVQAPDKTFWKYDPAMIATLLKGA